MNLVLKNLKRIKLVIYKRVTLIDFLVLLAYCGLISVIYYTMNMLNLGIKILVMLIFAIIGLLLIIEIKYRRKGYQLVWLIFKYTISIKKYQYKTKNDSRLLVPYQNLKDSYLIIGGNGKENNNQFNEICLAVKLEGFSISLLDKNVQLKHMRMFTDAIRVLEKDCSLIKIDKPLNLSKHNQEIISYGSTIKKLYENQNFSFQGYKSRVKQLANYYQINQLLETIPEISEPNWYLLVYGYDNENLVNQCKLFIRQISGANINCEILNGKELLQLVNRIYYPKKELTIDDDAQLKTLPDLLAYQNVKVNRNHIKVNDSYLHIHNVFEYPIMVDDRWLEQITLLKNTTVVLNINRISKIQQKKQLEKGRNILETNLLGRNKKFAEKELLINIENINSLMNAVASGVEELVDTNLLIMTYADTYEELLAIDHNLQDLCKIMDFKLDNLTYQQFDGLSSLLPKRKDFLFNFNSVAMPLSTLGACYPFITSNLNDVSGLFLGVDNYDNPIFYDQKIRDKTRKNSNQLIIGTSGSGKSYLMKKELNWHIATGKKVIIIDPEREYKNLATYYDGTWIDVGKTTQGKINPLQIFNNLQEDNEDPLAAHLHFLEEFLDLAVGGLNRDEKVQLLKLIGQLYHYFNITRWTDFNKLQASDFPVMNDLYLLAKKEYEMTQQAIFKDLSLLLSRFAVDGIDAKLWNGYSTIKTSNNFCLVFDLYTLTESGNKRIINAQIFLILKYIESEVRKNKNWNEANSTVDSQWIVITVDEAHLLIDKKYPSALYFMFSMVKRIRKYYGMMNIITQNINDFVGDEDIKRETTAIINGVQYLKCLQLSPNDLTALEQLYRSYGGISEIEKNSIARFNVGETLFSLGGNHRMELTINVSDVEKDAMTNY